MNTLSHYLDQVADTIRTIPQGPLEAVGAVLWETYLRDSSILICGNGGSAATASHFACDLTKWTARPGLRRIRSLALTESVPLMTAWSNDQSYADLFVEQLATHYRPGDVVFAISGSGNSQNVLRAVRWANEAGALTVGLCGFDGGALARLATYVLHINNHLMPLVEDVHSAICHAFAVALGKRIDEMRIEPEALPASREVVMLERSIGN